MQYAWETGEVHTGFWWRDLRERGLFECLGLRWDKNKNSSSRCGIGGVVWIDLAENRVRWLALVNAAMNLRAI
jgi:hypothetical protein